LNNMNSDSAQTDNMAKRRGIRRYLQHLLKYNPCGHGFVSVGFFCSYMGLVKLAQTCKQIDGNFLLPNYNCYPN